MNRATMFFPLLKDVNKNFPLLKDLPGVPQSFSYQNVPHRHKLIKQTKDMTKKNVLMKRKYHHHNITKYFTYRNIIQ